MCNPIGGNELAAGLGEHANFIPQGVTHATEWDEVIGGTEARFGTINVLSNNVGMAGTACPHQVSR
jgi:NAD(P)-dependent dehydrogenase (short-subunit alcohol dehydrogenase family)